MGQAHMIPLGIASLVLASVAVLLLLPGGRVDNPALNIAVTVAAIAVVALSLVVAKMMPRGRRAMLVALALCELSALLGLVLHFVTGWRNAWMLFVLAGLGIILHFPLDEDR